MKSGIIPSHYEHACTDVRDAVSSMRDLGFKAIAATYEVARAIGVSQARVRRLFFREVARVDRAERWAIRDGVIRHHRRMAAKHRALAAREESLADSKELEKYLNQLLSGETIYEPNFDRREPDRKAA